jgi:4-hydroxy-tetrahydrodipicolinate reductase
MGSGMAELLLRKKGVEITGIAGRGGKIGKSMYDFIAADREGRPDIIIGKPEDVITEKAADIVLLCTDSFTARAFDKIQFIIEKKINVITSAEEMAYPAAREPELARRIDTLAKANGVSVLGTGINPGLIMDLLAVLMTGCCREVGSIEARRVNSLSPFGPAVMEEQGIGLTEEEFRAKAASGALVGHVGFAESISMIADAVGWKVDKITQSMEPLITAVDREAPHGFAKAGTVAGVAMKGEGVIGGEVKISMDHPQQIAPEAGGVVTGDYITIRGIPDITLSNVPEVPGGIGTIAMCVNMIPHVINAPPGLKTMIDLPPPRAIMGDMRDFIHNKNMLVP